MKGLFVFGNRKLPSTTAIFNMGPASNGAPGGQFRMLCPEYHKGLCQLNKPETQCYAVKAERQYPNVRAHRTRQAEFWKRSSAEEFVAAFNVSRRRTTKALRFNESGGIAGQSDIQKIANIARALPDLTVYLYTSRVDLWEAGAFDCLPPGVTVNGSGFMAHNAFRSRPAGNIPKGAFVCGMDCRTCDVCSRRNGLDIFVELH